MADQELDAKEGIDEGPGGESSTSSLETTDQLDMEHFDPDKDNVIDTVEDDNVGGVDVTTGGAGDKPGKPSEESKGKDGSGDDSDKKDGDDTADPEGKEVPERFDKDPAWQRIIKERNEARTAAEASNQRVKALEAPTSVKEDGSDKIVDISTLSNEELIDWQNDDPKGYAENLRKYATQDAVVAVRADLNREKQEADITSSYDKYNNDNPANDDNTGFVQMWDAGKIQAYMDENPGNTSISAHRALTYDDFVKKAVDKAVTKAKDEMVKEQKARIVTDGLGTGPGYAPKTEDKELHNTKKRGGLVTALADRLAKRRQG